MKRQRILVLVHHNLIPPEGVTSRDPDKIPPWRTEFDVIHALRELGHDVQVCGLEHELMPLRKAVEEFQPHVVFNLITYFHNVGAYDAHVVSYLELLMQPYTGCNPRGLLLSHDKGLSKKVLAYHRIPIPRFAVFRPGRKVRRPKRLPFPLFVKSMQEHASMGISQASVVHTDEALAERVEFIHRTVRTDAIAEQYLEGREFYVGVLGNERLQALPVWELTFERLPEGTEPIATSKVKWDVKYQEKLGVMTGPADLSEDAVQQIQKLAKRIYRTLGLSGCARIDLRMDDERNLFVLEANPNPELARDEDFARSAEFGGIPYPELIQKLVSLGGSYHPAWKRVE